MAPLLINDDDDANDELRMREHRLLSVPIACAHTSCNCERNRCKSLRMAPCSRTSLSTVRLVLYNLLSPTRYILKANVKLISKTQTYLLAFCTLWRHFLHLCKLHLIKIEFNDTRHEHRRRTRKLATSFSI
ncbi:hypothetical protein KM620_gp116 [Hyposidra talaca nucleopolyhedrovirus]|uniref:Uncharacterized protein n=1 Tax=Hyposidra talaca nucleopolyhedrovirus TaxID=1070315 RepID=A0A2Z4HI66_9ABAC|nr:hypothetical protein KM620_gp116 [Hyposidra talaca nucleopolyhedrovirus]AWW14476.1 hypothetical protein HytaNPV_gp116 [Hyposidra talaca nucleopolyhedrovirus]